jgi:hypothetical protein
MKNKPKPQRKRGLLLISCTGIREPLYRISLVRVSHLYLHHFPEQDLPNKSCQRKTVAKELFKKNKTMKKIIYLCTQFMLFNILTAFILL